MDQERRIQEANDLFDALVEAQREVNARRYEAEAAYSAKKNLRLVFWMDQGKNATYARAQAEHDALEEFKAWQATKLEYHHLEDLAQALRTRIYSMLNINKSVQAAYNSYRGS